MIVDLGAAVTFNCEDSHGVSTDQPGYYRTPEVIVRCGWRTRADMEHWCYCE